MQRIVFFNEFIMESLLAQLKKRRITLGLKQHDMMLRVGMSRQQYQRLESQGNPRLDTLELIAKGLGSELMLIPQEKLNAVKALLAEESTQMKDPSSDGSAQIGAETSHGAEEEERSLADDPWKDLLEGDK